MRLPNWVGDVCKALPALHALQNAGFELHFALRRPLDDLVAGFVRPAHLVGKGILGPARVLRQAGCSRGLIVPQSFGTAASARLAGIRAVGFRADFRDWLLYRAVEYPARLHEVAALVHLAHVAQQTFAPHLTWAAEAPERMSLPLLDRHRAEADAALAAAGIDAPFTLLCPMATGTRSGHSKIWPHWRELSRRLASRGRTLVACPGPGEEEACAAAVPEARLLAGVGLGAYAAMCARARQVVANDSGPLFMAAAVGAPVIGIYGVAVRPEVRPLGADFIGFDADWPGADDVLERIEV